MGRVEPGTPFLNRLFCVRISTFKYVEVEMADNKSKRGPADRRRVAGGEGYEVQYFARKHQISADQARKLIDRIGNNRDKLNKAAEKLTKN
jgi:hypothetical protein